MNYQGYTTPGGGLSLRPIRAGLAPAPKIIDVLKRGLPSKYLHPAVNAWRKSNMIRLFNAAYKLWIAEQIGIQHLYGALYLTHIRPVRDTSYLMKLYTDLYPTLQGLDFVHWASEYHGITFKYQHLGLAGLKSVTDVGVGFIVDAFQNSVEVENMKYHGIGTGTTAESAAQTALVTELTTEYNPDSTRATGSLTEGASANIFRTVGTNTLDGTPGAALREHAIFSASSAGVMLDRTLYAAITLSSGDGLQSTYDLTFPSNG